MMSQSKDDTAQLLTLAWSLKKAADRTKKSNPSLAMRLTARLKKTMMRIRIAEAGIKPHSLASTAASRSGNVSNRVKPFGLRNDFVRAQALGIDLGSVCRSMAWRKNIFA